MKFFRIALLGLVVLMMTAPAFALVPRMVIAELASSVT
jgi:hypothetical protein